MVFVGHGSEDGIGKANALTIIQDIKNSPASHIYLLACGSNEIAKINPSLGIIGFGPAVDAEIGAMAIALRMAMNLRLVEKIDSMFDRFIDIAGCKIKGLIPILPLYYSDAERDNFFQILLISIGLSVIGTLAFHYLGPHFSFAASAAVNGAQTGLKAAIRRAVVYIATHGGIGATNAAITIAFGGVMTFATQMGPVFVTFMNIAINRMSYWDWCLYIALTIGEIAFIVLTASLALWYRIAAGIAIAMINTAVIGLADYADPDGVPCTSVFEAISQWT